MGWCLRVNQRLDRDPFRARLIPYTRQAFAGFPDLEFHDILDLGCGSGLPTLVLAKLTNGKITAEKIE